MQISEGCSGVSPAPTTRLHQLLRRGDCKLIASRASTHWARCRCRCSVATALRRGGAALQVAGQQQPEFRGEMVWHARALGSSVAKQSIVQKR